MKLAFKKYFGLALKFILDNLPGIYGKFQDYLKKSIDNWIKKN